MRPALPLILSVSAVVLAAGCQPRSSGDADSVPAIGGSDSAAAAKTTPSDTSAMSSSIVLTTDKTQYKAGENVTLTLTNHAMTTHSFNPCTRIIERESAGQWTVVPEPNRVCTMEAWLLEPHASRSGPTELPASLTPGQYRIVVSLTPEQPGAAPGSVQSVRAASPVITVGG